MYICFIYCYTVDLNMKNTKFYINEVYGEKQYIYICICFLCMCVLFCVRKIKGLFYLIVLVIGYFVMFLFYYLHQRICLYVYNDLFICF